MIARSHANRAHIYYVLLIVVLVGTGCGSTSRDAGNTQSNGSGGAGVDAAGSTADAGSGAGAGAGGASSVASGAGGAHAGASAGGASSGASGSDAGQGGAGANAGGSAGEGGAAGSPVTRCSMQIGVAVMPADPETRETIEGTNGTFSDECDADGNLIEYQCEVATLCGPNGMDCAPYPTGQVVPATIDCNGDCHDGVCDGV